MGSVRSWRHRRATYRALEKADRHPVTFNEKIVYKMAYDRRPMLRTFTDKYAVRSFVADRVGTRYLTQLHAVMKPGDPVPWPALPRQFVAKAAHGSGALVVVTDAAPVTPLPTDLTQIEWERLAVHPDGLVRHDLERLCRKWLSLDYELLPGRQPEWAYRRIPHRVIFEELLVSGAGLVPVDYKFFVFDGRCHLVYCFGGRFHDETLDLFTPDWEPLEVEYDVYPRPATRTPRPAALEEMIRVAEALGRDVDFVRVDLYDVGGRVVFGEMTNYPLAGTGRFHPDEFDKWLGSCWVVPETYRA